MYENLEIWWVTGAQLLYGGDAVIAVDAHSKEMVAGLNDSGNIPVKIVYKGTANSSKEVEDVMIPIEVSVPSSTRLSEDSSANATSFLVLSSTMG